MQAWYNLVFVYIYTENINCWLFRKEGELDICFDFSILKCYKHEKFYGGKIHFMHAGPLEI